MLRIILIFILQFNAFGLCLDSLRNLINEQEGFRFDSFDEVEVAGENRLEVLGFIKGSDVRKRLASFEYVFSEDGTEVDIGLMNTREGLQGLGLGRMLFEEFLERYPNVRKINSTMTNTNESILIRKIIESFIRDDIKIGNFNPTDSIEKQFEQCCGDYFMSLDNSERYKLILEAFRNTPAYKIRQNSGLHLCPDEGIVPNYSRRLGEFSVVVYTSFCR